MSATATNGRPKLYKTRDYFHAATHYAAAIALTAGVTALVGPVMWPTVAVVGGVCVLQLRAKPKTPSLYNTLAQHTQSPAEAPELLPTAAELTAKAGNPAAPQIYDFRINAANITKKVEPDSKLARLLREMPESLEAFSMGSADPVFVFSTPLLKLLSAEERKAVIAHEATHNAARHSFVNRPLMTIGLGVQIGAMAAIMTVIVATGGIGGLALTVVGAVAARHVAGKLFPRSIVNNPPNGLSSKQNSIVESFFDEFKTRKERLQDRRHSKAVSIAGNLAVLGVGSLVASPFAVLAALVARKGIIYAQDLILQSYRRRNEFQADRGAAALGADPLALLTGLRKLEEIDLRDYPEAYARADYRQGTPAAQIGKRMRTLLRSHPNTERRCKRLASIARKQGRSAEDISLALTGPLDLSGVPPRRPPAKPPAPPTP